MKKKFLSVTLVLCLIASIAWATTSTINPNLPSQNSLLSSATLRANFLAAYNDINNLYNSVASVFTPTANGLVPFPGSSTDNTHFLNASGNWTIPAGSGSLSLTGGNSSIIFSPSTCTGGSCTAVVGAPTLSTLGGVEAVTPVSHQFVTGISTSGIPSLAQPSTGDISGLGTAAAANTGTSGATLGFLNGTLVFSGNDAFSSTLSIGGASPAIAGASLDGSQATNSWALPGGSTAARPGSPHAGELRYNSDTPTIEAFFNGTWNAWATGAGGSGTIPVNTISSSGASQALSFPASGSLAYDITLTANCTITLSGGTAGQLQTVTLILRQDGTAGRIATLPAGIKWPNGIAPIVNTTAGVIDVFRVFTSDGGTTLFGSY